LSYDLCSAPVLYRGFLVRQPFQEASDLRLRLAADLFFVGERKQGNGSQEKGSTHSLVRY
jgi:hypothetical protein